MFDQTLESLRTKTKQLVIENSALRWITNGPSLRIVSAAGKRLEVGDNGQLEDLDSFTKSDLRRFIENLRDDNSKIRRAYGFRVSNSSVVKIFRECRAFADGHAVSMPAHRIRKICTRYGRVLKGFDELPAHGLVVIHPQLTQHSQRVHWYLIEEISFREMCAIFNRWWEAHLALINDLSQREKSQKQSIQRDFSFFVALGRAAMTSAFNFLEAYLNGLASDYLIRNWNTLYRKDFPKRVCPKCGPSLRSTVLARSSSGIGGADFARDFDHG
jgi:hypothetical protein